MSEQPIKILKRHVRELYARRIYMKAIKRERRWNDDGNQRRRTADTVTTRALIRAIRVLQRQDDTAADLKLALDERETLHARIKELQQLADQTERERDEWKARHDTLADVSRKCIATAERERDEARAERDARPDISAEDAAAWVRCIDVSDEPGGAADVVKYRAVNDAIRAHAAKAGKP